MVGRMGAHEMWRRVRFAVQIVTVCVVTFAATAIAFSLAADLWRSLT